MKNETTAINFDQEADMLYPTLNKVEELLKEYQMVPVILTKYWQIYDTDPYVPGTEKRRNAMFHA